MSVVEVKCEHCNCIKDRLIECDGCGKRVPHPYGNLYPAGWYIVRIHERISLGPEDSKSYDHELEELLNKDACCRECLGEVLTGAHDILVGVSK